MADAQQTEQDLGSFVHLHVHSEYSSLDGGSRIDRFAEALQKHGQKAIALTDHGVMQGLAPFQDALQEESIKPILGIEAYLCDDRHDTKSKTWHITLLAENNTGYKNLCKLSTWAFIEGCISTFGRPRARADWELLERYSEGVICLTGCMASPVMGTLMGEGDVSKAKRYVERLVGIFGAENVYGEIQNAGITTGVPGDSEIARWLGKEPLTAEQAAGYEDSKGDFSDEIAAGDVPVSQTEANRALVDLICKPLGLRYVATGDVHYLYAEDADPHDTMICIGTGQLKNGSRRFSLLPKSYHLRSEQEMLEALPEWPEALAETVEVARRCNAEIEWGRELLPRFDFPPEFESSRSYLRHLCEQGLEERYPEGHPAREQAIEQLNFELETIDSMGFNDYFLITWDLFNEARRRNIPYGPGRGSAAGAIVAYTLGITQLSPLEYQLLFERFLNPARRSMPDIDMDFAQEYNGGREALMEYAREKYTKQADSETAVAQIVTFSKYKARGAIKDSARVLAEPSEEGRKAALRLGDRLASIVPEDPSITISKMLDPESKDSKGKHREACERLRRTAKGGGIEAKVIEQALWMEGLVRAYSTHAAAVVIGDHDLTEDLPLQKLSDSKPLETQYDMGPAERTGLLKMDFLGLRNLDIIWDACEKIKHTRGIEIDPYKDIPLDDEATYKTFASGDTAGLFQFECLAGDTVIGDGTKTIAELAADPPRQLDSIDLGAGKRRRNEVLAVLKSGEKQLYRLRTESGLSLRASADHKLMTDTGWKRLGDLRGGEMIVASFGDAEPPRTDQEIGDAGPGRAGAPLRLPAGLGYDRVAAIEIDAVEMAYDIAMRAPLNNYIAGGLLVHNSGGMQGALQTVRPSEFRDLIALVALYRPGPMAHIPHYAARKHGREEVRYVDDRLADILRETYGICVYQEQSMMIARELAGFSPAEADDLRKAIGKKLRDKMEALKEPYIKGCLSNGLSKEQAMELWADNEAAADYSFNKSHAACYAFVSYITGYLKTHYPEEYMAALLSTVMNHKDKGPAYLRATKGMGLVVRPPDINRSLNDFAVMESEENPGQLEILFGLEAFKGVGESVIKKIKREREARGPFTSLYDLIRRMPSLNKGTVQTLIKGGALDVTGATRKGMFEASGEAIERVKKEIKDAEKAFIKAMREASERDGKRPTLERRGIDAATKLIHYSGEGSIDQLLGRDHSRSGSQLTRADLKERITEGLNRERMRLARAELRKKLKENPGQAQIAGIADEESAAGSDERETINEAAERQVAGLADETERLAAELVDVVLSAARTVQEESAEQGGADAALARAGDPPLSKEEWDRREFLNIEREVLKIYVSGHPMDEIRDQWAWTVDRGLGQLTDADITDGKEVSQYPHVAGVLVGHETRKIRSGTMHKLTVEDLTGAREIVVWPDTAESYKELLNIGEILSFRVSVREDTFAKQRNEDQEADPDGDGGTDGDEQGTPVQLFAARIHRWNPSLTPKLRPPKEIARFLGIDAGKTPPEEVQAAIDALDERQRRQLELQQSASAGDPADAAEGTSGRDDDEGESQAPDDGADAEESKDAAGAPAKKRPRSFVIPLSPEHSADQEWKRQFVSLLREHPGPTPVRFKNTSDGKTYKTNFQVALDEALLKQLREHFESFQGKREKIAA